MSDNYKYLSILYIHIKSLSLYCGNRKHERGLQMKLSEFKDKILDVILHFIWGTSD